MSSGQTSAFVNEKVSPSRLIDIAFVQNRRATPLNPWPWSDCLHGFALDWVSPLTALNVTFIYLCFGVGTLGSLFTAIELTLWWKMVSPWQRCLPSVPPQLLQCYVLTFPGKKSLRDILDSRAVDPHKCLPSQPTPDAIANMIHAVAVALSSAALPSAAAMQAAALPSAAAIRVGDIVIGRATQYKEKFNAVKGKVIAIQAQHYEVHIICWRDQHNANFINTSTT